MAITVFDHLPESNKENSFQQTAFLIQQCIDHHQLDDAVFLAEMLHERVRSDDSLLTLCDCLLRLSRTDEVYHLLQRHPKSTARLRYLYAKCCFDLKKYDECERALVDNRVHPAQLHGIFDDTLSAPFAGNLLAMVFCQTGRVDLSRAECSQAIHANPFIWSAVRKYVQVGGEQTKELMKQLDMTTISPPKKPTKVEKSLSTKKTPLNTRPIAPKPVAPKKTRAVERTQQQAGITEARRSLRLYNQDTENAGSRGALTRGTTPRIGKNQGVRKVIEMPPATVAPPQPRRSRETKPLQSRSANALRSLSSSTTSVASTASQAATESVMDSSESMTTTTIDDAEKVLEPFLKDIYESVQLLAEIEEFISSHQWLKATNFLAALPLQVSRQSLALLMRGRVLFELSNYEAAKDVLQQLKRQHPHKVEGMELLSTALWQLQDAEGLSTLAQELTASHRRRPQTWCVVGNCFSLQRQHSLAVDCMERAVQLDSQFAYAYTLLGHELVYQEELERAAKAFRAALNISPNDYRAWYGLGQVHQRSEQLHLAQANMKRAVEINPRNMGILVSLAQVEQALGHLEQAMVLLTQALELNPNDVAVRYNRARLLYDMRKEQECLEELNRLKELSPDEAHIFQLLGKVHRRLENTHKALLNYSWAAEMDPRGEQMQAHGLADNYQNEEDSSVSPEDEEEEED